MTLKYHYVKIYTVLGIREIEDQREYHRNVLYREPLFAGRWQESFMGMGLWDAKWIIVADAVFLTLQGSDMGTI